MSLPRGHLPPYRHLAPHSSEFALDVRHQHGRLVAGEGELDPQVAVDDVARRLIDGHLVNPEIVVRLSSRRKPPRTLCLLRARPRNNLEMDPLDRLLDDLARAQIGTTFNPYREADPALDRPGAPAIRLANLATIFELGRAPR